MGYDAELWACYSKVKFPQNRGRTTKKEKGSLQIREVYLQSLNQHTGEVKLEVDETLKDLDVFKSPLKIKNKKRKRKKKGCAIIFFHFWITFLVFKFILFHFRSMFKCATLWTCDLVTKSICLMNEKIAQWLISAWTAACKQLLGGIKREVW